MSFFDAIKSLVGGEQHTPDTFAENLERLILLGAGMKAEKFLKKYPNPTLDDFFEFQKGYEEEACTLLARKGFYNLEKALPSDAWEQPGFLDQLASHLKQVDEDDVQDTLDLLYHSQDVHKEFFRELHSQEHAADLQLPGIQITLMRHGSYDSETKHIDDIGAQEITNNALLLKGASYPLGVGIRPMAVGSFPTGIKPDLIVTSQINRAIESGQILHDQLQEMGISTRLQTGVAYFNEIEKYFHNDIRPSEMPPLLQSEQTQKALEFLQRSARDGARHIVVVSHKPNVHVLGSALAQSIHLDPPGSTGDIISVKTDKPENLGQISFGYGTASAQEYIFDDTPYQRLDRFMHRRLMTQLWHPLSASKALTNALKNSPASSRPYSGNQI